MQGERALFAKALTLALAMRCHQQRRPFVVLTFGSVQELDEFRFPVGASVWRRLREVIGLAFNGGTDFDGPLRRICQIVDEAPWAKADAVFVTDGECRVSESTKEKVKEAARKTDLEIIGVLVGSGAGLEGVADTTYTVNPGLHRIASAGAVPIDVLKRLSGRL